MKKIWMMVLLAGATSAHAVNFNDYLSNYTTTYLKPLAKDLGAIMGGGTFHRAGSVGFPGLDVGVDLVGLTSGESTLLKGQLFFMPYGRAEVGLPLMGIDVMVRGFQYAGLTILGGGVKYPLPLFPSLPVPVSPTPSLAAVATYHTMTFGSGTDQLTATVLSINGVLGLAIPGFPLEPYVGGGMDFTSMTAKKASVVDIPVTETGTRLVGGLNLAIFPLIYASGEIGLANSVTSFTARVGIKLP